MKTIRIFISSPGDVAEERDKAKLVIDQLQRAYGSRVNLVSVLWEDLPLTADSSFQDGIDLVLSSNHGIDIAIFILWSRLGSPVGGASLKPDGTPFRSGTEREFYLMLEARTQSGNKRPQLLVYTRDDNDSFKSRLSAIDLKDLSHVVEQQRLAEEFIREQFHDDQGRNVRAYHSYDKPQNFAGRLRVHLRSMLDELIGDAEIRDIHWDRDPYRGLQVFDLEHAPIFFGREREICELEELLRKRAAAGCAFAVIVGASGSGKSSLARAGLAAALVRENLDESIRQWRLCIMQPGNSEHSPIATLVDALTTQPQALPELLSGDREKAPITAGLARDSVLTVQLSFSQAFAQSEKTMGGPVRLLLIVDQMEELWTARQVDQEQREQFMNALEALARSGHVWVLATLRADFYHLAQQSEAFLRMKGSDGQFDLVAPGLEAVHRMIVEPARLAGMIFETHERTHESLDETIVRQTAGQTDALPLLEFALDQLFKDQDSHRRLTFSAYEKMGGVEGALGQQAEAEFLSLPRDAQDSFGEVINALVTVDADAEAKALRRTAPQFMVAGSPARDALLQAFVKRRFLTTDRDCDTPIVRIAHEALLRRWERLSAWIATNREHLRLRARVEQLQSRWERSGRDISLLLTPGLPLEEGRKLLKDAQKLLSAGSTEYISASIAESDIQAKRQRRSRMKVFASLAAMLCLSILGVGFGIQYYNYGKQQDRLLKEKNELADRQLKLNKAVERSKTFLVNNLLGSADRDGMGPDVLLVATENAARQVDASLADYPEQLAELHLSFYESFVQLGQYDQAETEAKRLLALAEQNLEHAPDRQLNPDEFSNLVNRVISARIRMCMVMCYKASLGDAALLMEAAKHLGIARELAGKHLGNNHPTTLRIVRHIVFFSKMSIHWMRGNEWSPDGGIEIMYEIHKLFQGTKSFPEFKLYIGEFYGKLRQLWLQHKREEVIAHADQHFSFLQTDPEKYWESVLPISIGQLGWSFYECEDKSKRDEVLADALGYIASEFSNRYHKRLPIFAMKINSFYAENLYRSGRKKDAMHYWNIAFQRALRDLPRDNAVQRNLMGELPAIAHLDGAGELLEKIIEPIEMVYSKSSIEALQCRAWIARYAQRNDKTKTLKIWNDIVTSVNQIEDFSSVYPKPDAMVEYLSGLDVSPPQKALETFDRALTLDPNFVPALRSRAQTLQRLKRDAEALETWDRVFAGRHATAQDYIDAGFLAGQMRDEKRSMAWFGTAAIEFPLDSIIAIEEGWAMLNLRRSGEAIAAFERARKVASTESRDAEFFAGSAAGYWLAGKNAEAIDEYKALISIDANWKNSESAPAAAWPAERKGLLESIRAVAVAKYPELLLKQTSQESALDAAFHVGANLADTAWVRENSGKVPTEFYFFNGDLSQPRHWVRLNESDWEERYPDGAVGKFKVIGRTSAFSGPGTLALRADKKLEVFLPDIGVNAMAAWRNPGDEKWNYFPKVVFHKK